MGTLKDLNDSKLIVWVQVIPLIIQDQSYTIRTFRGSLFHKPVTCQELFLLFLTANRLWRRPSEYFLYTLKDHLKQLGILSAADTLAILLLAPTYKDSKMEKVLGVVTTITEVVSTGIEALSVLQNDE